MTRKHYRMIAERINAQVSYQRERGRPGYGQAISALREMVSSLSSAFAQDNPSFKAEVFVKACGF